MRRVLRWWFRTQFAKALDQADWRTATFPQHLDASREVDRLRQQCIIVTQKEKRVTHEA